MKRVLCIWLPDWPIQRLVAARPELKQRPLVLHETRRGVQRVAVCSARARALGAVEGMTLAEVNALVGIAAKPQAADPVADREGLESLAEQCERFSPMAALEESAAPQGLLLDVTGLARLFGTEAALAKKVVHHFTRRGLTARAAVADTIGAAWAMAHFQEQGSGVRGQGSGFGSQEHPRAVGGLQIENCKLKIANCSPESLNSEPRTLNSPPSSAPTAHCPLPTTHYPLPTTHCSLDFTIVPCGEALAALRPLPVAALRLAEETVGLLRQLGVDRIGQLEALPRRELSSRLGPELLRRWDQALGHRAEPLPVRRRWAQFEAAWSAEYPTARRETIQAALERLVVELSALLVREGRGAVQLECRLDCPAGGSVPAEPVRVSVGLFEPTASPRHLLELLQMQLEPLRIAAPVSAIRVTATATSPLVQRQQELFLDGDGDDSSRASGRHLAGLVDRLSNRLGRRSVVRARLLSDAQPERAWCGDPLLGKRRHGGRRSSAPAELAPRPLCLLRRPLAVSAAALPSADGPPLSFHCCGRRHRTARTWGPERIETGWWRGRTVGRDYYRIETTTGRRFWLFRRLRDGRWFLHGTFE